MYPDGHALATISMSFMKDYKKPSFSRSRQANPTVKLSSATAGGTFQSTTSAYSLFPLTCDESNFMSWLPERLSLSGSDPSPGSQIASPQGRSAVSYPSASSSVSVVQEDARTTPVHVPRLRLNEIPARPDQNHNHPPDDASSLLTFAKIQSTMTNIQADTERKVDHDMTPTIFEVPSVRISPESPTASHQDRPCVVSDFPTAITKPCQARISQPSSSQISCLAVSPTATGVKRRLGMGRTTGGYSNKKFKPPT